MGLVAALVFGPLGSRQPAALVFLGVALGLTGDDHNLGCLRGFDGRGSALRSLWERQQG